jgi:hypothetical protein
MYLLFIMYVTVHNDFEVANIQYKGHWKGLALEIKTFLGPEMTTSKASAIWAPPPKKSQDFQSPSLPMPGIMDLPDSES